MAENIQREIHPQVRLRNRLLLCALAGLAVVNAVAGYFDIHSTIAIIVCNVVGGAVFVAAVVLEFMRMIPRKRWRALSFLVTGIAMGSFLWHSNETRGPESVGNACYRSGSSFDIDGRSLCGALA